VVKADLRVKPVPHTLLLTCNRVAAVGMDASLSLFSEPGPDATSVTALAARLGAWFVLLVLRVACNECGAPSMLCHVI
jgi:hypothetical protein